MSLDQKKLRLEMYEDDIQKGIEPLRSVLSLLAPIAQKMEQALPALLALRHVKEEGLYKDGYKTWENYCKYWQIDLSVKEIDRLLEWAGVVEKLKRVRPDASIPNEAQAHELRDMDEDEMGEVWDEVGSDPTAKRVRDAAQKRTIEHLGSMPKDQQKEYVENRHKEALDEFEAQDKRDWTAYEVMKVGERFRKCPFEDQKEAARAYVRLLCANAGTLIPDWAQTETVA